LRPLFVRLFFRPHPSFLCPHSANAAVFSLFFGGGRHFSATIAGLSQLFFSGIV